MPLISLLTILTCALQLEAIKAERGETTTAVVPAETEHLLTALLTLATSALQLEAIKAERGETTEAVVPDKPLAVVLAEAKQAKEDAFQAQWKQMKTGAPSIHHEIMVKYVIFLSFGSVVLASSPGETSNRSEQR